MSRDITGGGETASKQEATATALDRDTDFVGGLASMTRNDRRRVRFERQAEARKRAIRKAREDAGLEPGTSEGWAKPARVAFCGMPAYGGGAVEVRAVSSESGSRAHFSRIARCGSIWTCPTCSAIIRSSRGEEVMEAARRHCANGGGMLMITFTTRHTKDDSFKGCFDLLSDAWRKMQQGQAWRRWRKENGVIGFIKAVEITYGQHGPHVHMHVLLFLDYAVTHAEEHGIKLELFSMWSGSVERAGGRPLSFDAFDVQAIESGEEAAAAYVAKLDAPYFGVACEVSLADVKSGRAEGSINPFELLDMHTAEAVELWNEYVEATRGKSAIRWSRGLRAALGMDAVEKTDEEVVAEAQARGDVEMLIERELYVAKVAKDPKMAPTLLEMVESGRVGEAGTLLGVEPYWTVVDGVQVPVFSPFGNGGGGVLLAVA